MNRKDFTIQKAHTIPNAGKGDNLLLCYKGELVPFQVSTSYETSAGSVPQFVVRFECFGGEDSLAIRECSLHKHNWTVLYDISTGVTRSECACGSWKEVF